MPLFIPSPPVHPGYKAGTYSTFVWAINTATAVAAVDTLYLYPFILSKPITFASGHMRVVTGGAGSSTKVGIWANGTGATNRPVGAPLFADNTGVATATSSTSIVIPIAGTLPPGFYWVGSKFTGTLPVLVSVGANQLFFSYLMGATVVASPAMSIVGVAIAAVYASDLPTLAEGASFSAFALAGIPVLGLTV